MRTAVDFSALIRAFRLSLTVEGLKPHTVGCYVRDAERLAAFCGDCKPSSVTSGHVNAFLTDFRDGRSAKTVRETQLGLRRFFRFLQREGEVRRDPTREMKLSSFRVDPQPTYTEAEVKRLLLACDQRTREGVRDRAMLLTLFDTGVRAGELVSMGAPDWDGRAPAPFLVQS